MRPRPYRMRPSFCSLSAAAVTLFAPHPKHVSNHFLRDRDVVALQAIQAQQQPAARRWSSEWRRLQTAVCAVCVISACV